MHTPLITILGPTATGKTTLATHLAASVNGEVISADSRQVYRGMDIGTGKDLGDFIVNSRSIPYHLIDIVNPGYEYNIFEFQKDVHAALESIHSRAKRAILCGGSGMYIESVLRGYQLNPKTGNEERLQELINLPDESLRLILEKLKRLHNTTDTLDRQRLIQAILIAEASASESTLFTPVESILFGVHFDREIVRQRITERLDIRLQQGMIEEVQRLLQQGLTPEQLKFYGLEYKYVTMYLQQELTYEEMFNRLNIAIHQFAKRQMTWFRRMEKNGFKIEWIDGNWSMEEKLTFILRGLENYPNR